MLIPIYGIYTETMTCSLSYHDPLVEPLLSHLVRPTLFGIQMSSCFPLGCLDSTQLWIWMTGIAHLMMDDLMLPVFSIYRTSDATLGYISPYHSLTYFVQHSKPPCLLSYDVQSRLSQFAIHSYQFIVWSSKRPSHYSLVFRAVVYTWHSQLLFQPGIQSHLVISSQVSENRAIISSQFWRSEPLSVFSFGIQSHHLFSAWRSEPPFLHSLTFKAIILSRLGIHCHLFGVQSYILGDQSHCSFLEFRAVIHSQSSEPSFIPRVQSHYIFSVSAFRATISSQFRHSKPSSIFNLPFRATIPSQLQRLEPPSPYNLTLRVTIILQL